MQPAPLLPPHPPGRCALRKVPALSPVLSFPQIKYISFVSSSSLASIHRAFFPHTYTSVMPSIMSSFSHVFVVFISSASFLALAPYSPPSSPSKTPITSRSLLCFQIKFDVRGLGSAALQIGSSLNAAFALLSPGPASREVPPSLPSLSPSVGPAKGQNVVKGCLPQPGIPSLARPGLHPTAGSS